MTAGGPSLSADDGRVIEIEAYFLVMFHHPAHAEGVWRTWGRAGTRTEAGQRLHEAKQERPEYDFRLAVKRTVVEWADDE